MDEVYKYMYCELKVDQNHEFNRKFNLQVDKEIFILILNHLLTRNIIKWNFAHGVGFEETGGAEEIIEGEELEAIKGLGIHNMIKKLIEGDTSLPYKIFNMINEV